MSYIEGGPWNDQIQGGGDPDTLLGGKGNDTLFGNGGDDHLFGNQGHDLLDGGLGSDTYLFAPGDGHDTVLAGPGTPGQADRLKLTSGIAMADVEASQQGGDLLLRLLGRDDSVRIANYFSLSELDRPTILFDAGGQWDSADVLRKLWPTDDVLHGTPGDDVLDGGAGRDSLFGHEGRDTLYGDAGNDWLHGDAGHDTYLFGKGDGQDTVVAGNDFTSSDRVVLGAGIGMTDIDVREAFGDLLINIRGGDDSLRIGGYFNVPEPERTSIQFADGVVWDGATVLRKVRYSHDNLYGSPAGGLLDGGLGDDGLQGQSGDDTLYGDGGNDRMDGGDGADTIVFGRGDGQDTVFARPEGPRTDRVLLGAGIGMADVAVSAEGGDLLLRVSGTPDVLRIAGYLYMYELDRPLIQFADGGKWDGTTIQRKLVRGDDQLYGTPENDVLDGGGGRDLLQGHEGDDTLYGDQGGDWLDGGPGADTYVFGRNDGHDTVVAGFGNGPGQGDRVQLGADIGLADLDVSEQFGDLLLQINGGRDSLRIAGYFNLNELDRPVIDFANGQRWDALTVMRKLHPAPDQLMGTPGADLLDGGQGNDTLHAGEGRDTLYGDAGDDWLNGEQGADTYVFGRGDGRDTVVAGQGEPDQLDRLVLGAGIGMADVALSERSGDLVLNLRGSNDSVNIANYFGAYGPQRLAIEFADGSRWDADTVQRKRIVSDDILHGTPFGDLLDGGQGNDMLSGHEGDDTLYGDAGNDWMDGGPGFDTYVFGRGDGQDTVSSGQGNEAGRVDRLVLGAGIGLADVDLSQSSGGLLLSLRGSSDRVFIANYFGAYEPERTVIEFADGSVLNGLAVSRRFSGMGMPPQGSPFDDVIIGRQEADDIQGQEGDDTLYGDAGNDWLDGGMGSDTYVFGRGDGRDTVVSGFGGEPGRFDRLVLGSDIGMADVDLTRSDFGELRLTVRDSGEQVSIVNYLNVYQPDRMAIEFANGNQWDAETVSRMLDYTNDQLHGTQGNDLLNGGLGTDWLNGEEGNDTLYGDAGNDWLHGGRGEDTYVFGRGDGQDTVGADFIEPGAPDHVLLGSGITMADVDLIEDASGDLLIRIQGDSLRLSNYFRVPPSLRASIQFADGGIWSGESVEARLHAANNDLLYGTQADEVLDGGSGDDIVAGMEGDDTLYGGAGTDRLFGGAGADTYLFGRGDGHDSVMAESGPEPAMRDRLVLGADIGAGDLKVSRFEGDLILKTHDGLDSVTLAHYFSLQPQDRPLIHFGGNGNWGGQGAWDSQAIDRKFSSVRDALIGTDGRDLLDGGLGFDSLTGLGGQDLLIGDDGDDTLDGGLGADTMDGGLGRDVFVLDEAGDVVIERAKEGVDEVRLAYDVGPGGYVLSAQIEGARVLTGFDTTLVGNMAQNNLVGGSGNDSLFGGFGADRLTGGSGNDTLEGATGTDRMVGNAGSDTYVIERGDGFDLVFNYSTNQQDVDIIQFNDVSASQLWLRREENDLEISVIGEIGSTVWVGDWYLGGNWQVDGIRIGAAGPMLRADKVQSLVNAMAAFKPPEVGQTDLPAVYQAQLNGVIAASWV